MPIPEDLKADLGGLAKRYGDVALIEAMAESLRTFAVATARRQLAEKKGNPEIECPRCRERDAHARQIEETLKRTTTGRPIGGAAPTQEE